MKIVVFWVVTPYSLVDTYVADVSKESSVTCRNIRNVGNFLPNFTLSSQKKVALNPKYVALVALRTLSVTQILGYSVEL
jgi:hypothetical protein